jgi:hypothetical protein
VELQKGAEKVNFCLFFFFFLQGWKILKSEADLSFGYVHWFSSMWFSFCSLQLTMKDLLAWIRTNLIKERPEMFMKGDSV